MPDEPDLLTAKEAAEHLYSNENSLRTMRAKGCGPPFRKVGHRVFYSRTELERYVATMRPCDATQFASRRERAQRERGTSVEIRTRP